ncbi:MAG: hypothetical protein MUF64_04215 [Polyangiaceae bacterium]|jgi:hypothetical protein|nr:hypothetical protein [Polyangiaceae bacterium]
MRLAPGAFLLPVLLLLLTSSREGLARPGTHAPAISTWDTRASSVVPAFTLGSFPGGRLHFVSYGSNFSSTSGNLSAQFGLHYANFRMNSDTPTAHGLSGGAVALLSRPLAARYDNGVPRASLAFVLGGVPTVLIGGRYNFLSIPLVLGLGLPLSPSAAVTITPWAELSPGLNLDTVINPYNYRPEVSPQQIVDAQNGQLKLTQGDVEKIVSDAVDFRASFTAGLRGGLTVALRLTDSVDLDARLMLSSMGPAFRGAFAVSGGGGLVFRWDDVVPAVLPPRKRLGAEACQDIVERYQACPEARRRAEETLRIQGELRKRDEEIRRRDEEIRRRDTELKKRDDELRRREDEIRKRREEILLRDEEIRRKDDELRKKNDELREKDEELRRMQP